VYTRETKAEPILQLCLYSELVAELQGLEPELFHVIRPNVAFEGETARFIIKMALKSIKVRGTKMGEMNFSDEEMKLIEHGLKRGAELNKSLPVDPNPYVPKPAPRSLPRLQDPE
jgi:hypothetical protein